MATWQTLSQMASGARLVCLGWGRQANFLLAECATHLASRLLCSVLCGGCFCFFCCASSLIFFSLPHQTFSCHFDCNLHDWLPLRGRDKKGRKNLKCSKTKQGKTSVKIANGVHSRTHSERVSCIEFQLKCWKETYRETESRPTGQPDSETYSIFALCARCNRAVILTAFL